MDRSRWSGEGGAVLWPQPIRGEAEMQDTELYSALLGLRHPWRVREVRLDLAGDRVDVWVEEVSGAVWECLEDCAEGRRAGTGSQGATDPAVPRRGREGVCEAAPLRDLGLRPQGGYGGVCRGGPHAGESGVLLPAVCGQGVGGGKSGGDGHEGPLHCGP